MTLMARFLGRSLLAASACAVALSGALVAGCSFDDGADSKYQPGSSSVADVIESQASASDGSDAGSGAGASDALAAPAGAPSYSDSDVDVDLPAMGATAVYGEVSQMVSDPEAYIGKVVRMRGLVASSEDGAYHFVVIADATSCCSQGLEFVWGDGSGVYPADGAEVLVTGVFDSYDEDGLTYYHLRDSSLELV